MKEWFSAAELAKLQLPEVPSTERAIQLRAEREEWSKRRRQGRGGGWEYPVDDDPPSLLAVATVRVEEVPSGLRLRLPQPVTTGDVRVRYTATHILSDTEDTTLVTDREAIAAYAAAALLDQLAAKSSSDTDSTFGADQINRGTSSSTYAARAKDLRQRYQDQLGLNPDRQVAAGAVVAITSPAGNDGRPQLTHGPYSAPIYWRRRI